MPASSQPRKRRRPSVPAAELSEHNRHAALARWAKTPDRAAALQPANDANRARWYREADAQGVTDPVIREKMARAAQSAEMARLRALQLRRARIARQARDAGLTITDDSAGEVAS